MKAHRLIILLALAGFAQAAQPPEQKLLAVLRSDAPVFEKAKACQQLARIGTKQAVPALAALLGDEKLNSYALFGLEPIQDPSVDAALRGALPKLTGRQQIGVINSLGVRRDAKAVPALAKIAESGKEGAAQALWALGRIATDDAIKAIQQGLGGALRAEAAHACLAAAERRGGSIAGELCDAVRQANVPVCLRAAAAYQRMKAPGGVKLLVEQLKGDDGEMRAMALRAAREAPGAEMTRALVAELPRVPPAVQVMVIKALVSRQDRSAAKGIVALVESGSEVVRFEALNALGGLGGASEVPVLLKAATRGLKEEVVAFGSLTKLHGDGVNAALIRAIPACEGESRSALIKIIEVRGIAEAADALVKEAASRDGAQGAAFEALATLGRARDIPVLLKARFRIVDERFGMNAGAAIANIAKRTLPSETRSDRFLQAYAATDVPAERVALLQILSSLGDEKACSVVAAAVKHADDAVKDAAVRALSRWPTTRAASALLEIARSDEKEVYRVLAFRRYAYMLLQIEGVNPKEIVAKYAEALTLTKRTDDRTLVLGRLGYVHHADALALVMTMLDDPAVKEEAAMAAVTIADAIKGSDREVVRAAMAKIKGPQAEEARRIVAVIDQFADAITAWKIAGPYMQEGKLYNQLFDIVFEPEKPDAKTVKWQPIAAGTHAKYPQVLDLRALLGGDQRVAYALTWCHSEKAQPARLEMGSDDGIKAWLNGELVHANNVARAAVPYTDKVNVTLKQGWNPLLLKITQNQIPWEFCGRICGRDGKPLKGIKFDPSHDGEWRVLRTAAKPAPKPAAGPPPAMKGTRIFDGKTFTGWEGNLDWFRIEDGAIVGGTLEKRVPRNEFLCTEREYANFQLRLKVKLVKNIGNAGIQIRSQRIKNHHEMIGYQADIGQVYWGAIYDESRRRKVLAKPDAATLKKALKLGDWNDYVIRCEGKRIQLWLNGVQTVDYTEPDPKIPQKGIIGLQIHGGPPSEIWYKDVEIEVLP